MRENSLLADRHVGALGGKGGRRSQRVVKQMLQDLARRVKLAVVAVPCGVVGLVHKHECHEQAANGSDQKVLCT